MKNLFLCLVAILLATSPLHAQELPAGIDASFSVTSMNPLMILSQADAVVRLDNQQFEVKGRGKAIWRVHRAVTIFNKDGRDHGFIGYGYDKIRKPKKLAAQIRNAEGKVIRKLKKNEIEDYSAIANFSLYDDSRVRVARLEHATYPYTVEYWYELEFDGYISWPSWDPEGLGSSVEHSRYEVVAPADLNVRYRSEGTDIEPIVIDRGKQKIYRWEVTAIRKEAEDLLAALSMEVVPESEGMRVKIAPELFEIEGSKGDFKSWGSFGTWYYNLNAGRDALPAHKAAEVRRLVNGIADTKQRAKRVYDYFQSSTRYVSVQLGIGGWQTYDAAYVAERGYGDCKALTNYLKALLDVAGVPSQVALIENSRRGSDVEKDFPNNEFNHVILMVPTPADTLWLEATSQVIPFGRIGAGNEDRYALAVSAAGGELVRTPASEAATNAQVRHATVQLNEAGNATAAVTMTYSGNQQDRVTHTLVNASSREQMEWLHDLLEIPSFKVINADFSRVQARERASVITTELELPRYASRTGSRIFLTTNLLERQTYVPPEDETRSKPVKISYAYRDEDVITYTVPAGYAIEAMPEDVNLETTFARFTASHEVGEGTLTYKRVLEFTEKEIDAALFGAYRDFLSAVASSRPGQGSAGEAVAALQVIHRPSSPA